MSSAIERVTEQFVAKARQMNWRVGLSKAALARTGDREAFEALVYEFTPRIYRLARAIVGEGMASDVVQDVFLSAWRELPRLRDPQRFPAWLHRIAINCSRSALRRATKVRELDLSAASTSATPGDFRTAVETRAVLMPVLLALPFDQRVVVALHYASGLSLAQAAVALSVPIGTVKSRLSAALATLRAALVEAENG